VLSRLIRMDEGNELDTLLVALNVNDKLYLPHQNNVLPLAVAKGMGVIAMKVFADGVFFGKEARFSKTPADVHTSVGGAKIDSHEMVRYTVSLPGVCTTIIGTGNIDRKNPANDMLVANLAAATDETMTKAERDALEKEAAAQYGATTNYFQQKAQGLIQPTDVKVTKDGGRVKVTWQAAVAGAKPLAAYQVKAGGKAILTIPARPQLTLAPLYVYFTNENVPDGPVEVVAVEQRDVPIYREWVGTLEADVNATISAQVSGYLVSRAYTEGSMVTNGQLRFQIEMAPFQASLDKAQAQLTQAQAQKKIFGV